MRRCGRCQRVLRHDESLSSCFVVGWGNGQVCGDCQAAEAGLPPPEPARYPPGTPVPKTDTGADIPVCGLCRRALPEDEQRGRPLRIRPEMLAEGEDVECGGYAACRACVDLWRPRVLAYLQRLGLLPPEATERQVQGNLLV